MADIHKALCIPNPSEALRKTRQNLFTGVKRHTLRKLTRSWQLGKDVCRYTRTMDALYNHGVAEKMYLLDPECEEFVPKKHTAWRLTMIGEVLQKEFVKVPLKDSRRGFMGRAIDRTVN